MSQGIRLLLAGPELVEERCLDLSQHHFAHSFLRTVLAVRRSSQSIVNGLA